MYLYIDIETIPCQWPGIQDEIAAEIEPPGNISKAETIAKWEADKKPALVDEAYRKTALDGTLGEIVAISWAVDNAETSVLARDYETTPEGQWLSDALATIADDVGGRSPIWVGHYISGFDLRFIWQRCVINDIQPALFIPYDAKPWGKEVFDTKTQWAGVSGRGTSKLDALCRAMGFERKGDIDGSQVWDYVQDGRIQEVADYCAADVRRTRALHRRMAFLPPADESRQAA